MPLTRNFSETVNRRLECDPEFRQAVADEDERETRIWRLIYLRGMSPRAAATVVDAAMFGIGCIEGNVRREVQKKLDEAGGQ